MPENKMKISIDGQPPSDRPIKLSMQSDFAKSLVRFKTAINDDAGVTQTVAEIEVGIKESIDKHNDRVQRETVQPSRP